MSSNAATVYQLYFKEKGIKPAVPQHLTYFAKLKGHKLSFIQARQIIANPPSNISSNLFADDLKNDAQIPTGYKTNISSSSQYRMRTNTHNNYANKKAINKKSTEMAKIYNNYVSEYGSRPSNTYDLVNYIQYNNIKGITFKDVSNFLMRNNKTNNFQKHAKTKKKKTYSNTQWKNTSYNKSNNGIKSNRYHDDNVCKLYQIYYKAKQSQPLSAQQLINYGKSFNIYVKWMNVNKFLKNNSDYLNSLITDDALKDIVLPQKQIKKTINIKVETGNDEYYWVKHLTLNSKIEEISKYLEPRLVQTSAKINLYKDNQLLSPSHTLKQCNLKDGDVISVGVFNTSTGIDSFLVESAAKKKYYQKFQTLSSLATTSNQYVNSMINDYNDYKYDDQSTAAVDDNPMTMYTNSILTNTASGNVSNRDTLLHVMSGLASANGQQCLFFNSDENIVPKDKIEHNSHLHIIEANNIDSKVFVLTLNTLKNTNNNSDITKEEMYEMQKCIESNNDAVSDPTLEDIRYKLSLIHNVDKERIQIKGIFAASVNVEYTVNNLSHDEIKTIKENAGDMQNKINQLFDDYQKLNIHPILFRQTYDISMFDEDGNKTFDEKETYNVGKDSNGKIGIYTQPIGWTRYGLSVVDKFDNGDNTWLAPFQHENNWYRAFHGTGSSGTCTAIDAMSSIYKGGFHISYKDGTNGTTAIYGDGVYVSPNPQYVENFYASHVTIATQTGQKTFKFMLMVAVKPDSVVRDNDDIWHVPHAKDVRPYGILIKEV